MVLWIMAKACDRDLSSVDLLCGKAVYSSIQHCTRFDINVQKLRAYSWAAFCFANLKDCVHVKVQNSIMVFDLFRHGRRLSRLNGLIKKLIDTVDTTNCIFK